SSVRCQKKAHTCPDESTESFRVRRLNYTQPAHACSLCRREPLSFSTSEDLNCPDMVLRFPLFSFTSHFVMKIWINRAGQSLGTFTVEEVQRGLNQGQYVPT